MHSFLKHIVSYFVIPLLTVIIIYHAYVIYAFGQLQNEEVVSDTAIVLGASINQHRPSPVFKARINHAIELFKKNKVKRIIFTGGISAGNQYSESEVAQNYALTHGIPKAVISIEKASKITFENLLEAKKIMISENLSSALIVSDPLHMKRAITMANDLGMKANPSPTQTSMYRSIKTKLPFLAREIYFLIGYRIANYFGIT